ncbi:MAG: LLM class flavin-dependent oxidoreductase [Acidimicrobiales bacterium]|jgi:alkanesulfonate monooxygenase SsuD/methylene tetrahydromethanopterin reductase-like flavin-dependent oxidoreductase (luciferase family)
MQVRGRPLRFGVQVQPQDTSWPEYLAAVRGVENLDFDTVWTWDHLLPVHGPEQGRCFETLTTLGAMAAATSRVRVGVLVNGVLYRDPVTLAKAAATVDNISGGRLEFSLGGAWARREFKAYGLPFRSLEERYERLDEALAIIKSLWSLPSTTFEGRYYRVEEAPCEPKPLQQPHPPIMVGGIGSGCLRVAAKHADSSNAHGTPEQTAERSKLLQGFCQEVGRDFAEIELSLHSDLAVAPTHEGAEALAARTAARSGGDLEAQRPNWIIGTPDEVVSQFRRFIDVGVSHFIVHLGAPFDLTVARLLREEVAPAFR